MRKVYCVVGHQWETYESDHAEVYGNKVYETREEAIEAANAAAKIENEDENAWTHDLFVRSEQGDKDAVVDIDETTGSHEWKDFGDGRGYALWIEECEMEEHDGIFLKAEQFKTIDDIVFGSEALEQAIRNHVSNMLMDTDEQHPASVGVYVKADPNGFDTIEFDKAYMIPGDGRIYFHFEGYPDTDDGWFDFSNFTLDDKIHVLKQMYGV